MQPEQYSTVGATADIEQEGDLLVWAFDWGGVTQRGQVTIGEDGLGAAMARARKSVDAAAQELRASSPGAVRFDRPAAPVIDNSKQEDAPLISPPSGKKKKAETPDEPGPADV